MRLRESMVAEISDTKQLVVQQFQEVLTDNVARLENLKHRLEITGGGYFEYWSEDASRTVRQEPSFLFIEWIDSAGVIQRVEPAQENKEAIGLDITKLDYRNADWNKARRDSLFNMTHWLALVQGDSAFLVDAPVYINGRFSGSITAGMDFTERFDNIMKGLEHYHLQVKDDQGTVFYTFGDPRGTAAFMGTGMQMVDTINTYDANRESWELSMTPNYLFRQTNSMAGNTLNLVLALVLSSLFAITFFFMRKASSTEKSYKLANQKLRSLIDSSPLAILVMNSNGILLDFWNQSAEEMFGWKKEEVIGNVVPFVSDEENSEFGELLGRSNENGGFRNVEVQRTRKNGDRGWFRLHFGDITGDDEQMLVLVEDITKMKEYDQKLEKSLKEKKVLLEEIHHRVKNNLAIIIGLIELHKDGKEREVVSLLNDTQNRIYSISEVHEMLYESDNFSEISFDEYIDKLINRILQTYQPSGKKVDITRDLKSLNVNINQAIPLGLLLNELITNSFKHAFEDVVNPEIIVRIEEKDSNIEFIFRDNGRGFNRAIFDQSNSMGITLIKTLLDQLNARYKLEDETGFGIVIRFKVQNQGAHSKIDNSELT
ncbi:PAS domain S-box protein [Aliifodinibius sp. S!AR15-10]|uniref:histidine kinase dimerization/phosphoacceptor domain -containing protein n=1 Tax=Aliifodinibius sp. S!AR15-10 TaxID=2950437 RepID=UPI00285D50D0|nr:histidine kinase dimerization/phosphoacceptor domain -containing protein [Aliifodinibius sp. S!AR15-10]MDR8391691.1 PAS domain S-box protein [Aliifodinibius sp. S!AR15-10]